MAGENVALLADQVRRFTPKIVSVKGKDEADALGTLLGEKHPPIVWGEEGIMEATLYGEVDTVVAGSSGIFCLHSIIESVRKGMRVAIANKELLVAAGNIIMEEAEKSGALVIPVDSEHSAIFQALSGQRREDVTRLILTASGGPFYFAHKRDLSKVTAEEALKHPVWEMGKKITIDSATMMNKGFEIIEAMHLFRVSADKIDVVVHPQSIIHSMVEFTDGTILAQMGVPDMKGPIGYALSYPERLEAFQFLNIEGVREGLTFFPVDETRFPALSLAQNVAKKGGLLPAVLVAANDVAVENFIQGRIKFTEIQKIVGKAVNSVEERPLPGGDEGIEKIVETLGKTKDLTDKIIKEMENGETE